MMIYTDRREEPEDSKVVPVVLRSLAMPRPVQILPHSYPNVELDLPKINEALKNIDDKSKAAAPAIPTSRFEEGFDAFGGSSGGGSGDEKPGGGPPEMFKPGQVSPSQQFNIPDYCVVRFLDVTLESGKVYEYQVRVKMINPNYHKADNELAYPALSKERELTSPWADVKDSNQNWLRVSLPNPINYYVVDQVPLVKTEVEKTMPAKDFKVASKRNAEFFKSFQGTENQANLAPKDNQIVMQIHRWIGRDEKGYDVGDWVVAERVPATKGDYVGQWAYTKVPYYSPQDSDFILDSNPKAKKGMVPFVEKNFGAEPSLAPFLVDFDGGKVSHRRETTKDGKALREDITDNAPVEVLMLTPDGRLIARDSATDETDKDREKHRKAWVERIRLIDEEGKVVPTANGSGKPGGLPGGAPGGGANQ
jgi:hypothetical protein